MKANVEEKKAHHDANEAASYAGEMSVVAELVVSKTVVREVVSFAHSLQVARHSCEENSKKHRLAQHDADPITGFQAAVDEVVGEPRNVQGQRRICRGREAIDLTRWGSSGGLVTGGYENDHRDGFGSSDNVFGTVQRVVSPTVPAGTAILADWSKLKLFVHWNMTIMVNAFGDSLFTKNAVQLRAEMLVGVGVLRPQAFAVVDLTA